MTLFLPLVLIGPVMMLVVAVLALAAHGPLGWLAAAGLLAAVAWTCRWAVRHTCRLWASTKAAELPVGARSHWTRARYGGQPDARSGSARDPDHRIRRP